MAYMPDLHYCCICRDYLGPDNGDGICSACEVAACEGCGCLPGEGAQQDGGRLCSDRCDCGCHGDWIEGAA